MAKLTKDQAKQHAEAVRILTKSVLTYDERVFVLENWREDANHINGVAGAFFTPYGLARDLATEIFGTLIVDLCAGIGSLAFAAQQFDPSREITCVEMNPDYIEVGRKIVPHANWVCADVFDFMPVLADTKRTCSYDCAIANPPFGNVKTHKNQYGLFEYDLIAHAADLALDGVFLIPQMSCSFRYSGRQYFERYSNPKYEKFQSRTGIDLVMNCGIDTETYRDEWTIKPPTLEIALGFKEEL